MSVIRVRGDNALRAIDTIIIHCSASTFGSAPLIDEWHRERGWRVIGYHFVILNGIRAGSGAYSSQFDGTIEEGRPVAEIGAHTAGHNRTSIGICLIGIRFFTPVQVLEALPDLLDSLVRTFSLNLTNIFGHSYFTDKLCPGFDVPRYLRNLQHLGRF